ncbi:MAG: thymidine kinase [SAR86 cluster bacterium]|jgi:thymidine kinase|nr:thymidine kinase [SAR86 cluster bacterium]
MAKLYFYYSSMDAGKSTALLQANHNYLERGMNTVLFTVRNEKNEKNKIISRIGLSLESNTFSKKTKFMAEITNINSQETLDCILIDEAQFLTKLQVKDLGNIVDSMDIPILTYGLRTDFLGELFEGSKYLLAWADTIKEIKTICFCGAKATMVARISKSGEFESDGKQIKIGGNDRYVSLCRKHFITRVLS